MNGTSSLGAPTSLEGLWRELLPRVEGVICAVMRCGRDEAKEWWGVAWERFVQAHGRWVEGKGAPLDKWLVYQVGNQMRDEKRRLVGGCIRLPRLKGTGSETEKETMRCARVASLSEKFEGGSSGGDGVEWREPGCGDVALEGVDAKDEVMGFMASLSERERWLLVRRAEGVTCRQAGDEVGLCEASVMAITKNVTQRGRARLSPPPV